MAGAAYLADRTADAAGTQWSCCLELDDGYIGHAPVDRYRANPWGLHSVHGNVAEWCADHGPLRGLGAGTRQPRDDPTHLADDAGDLRNRSAQNPS